MDGLDAADPRVSVGGQLPLAAFELRPIDVAFMVILQKRSLWLSMCLRSASNAVSIAIGSRAQRTSSAIAALLAGFERFAVAIGLEQMSLESKADPGCSRPCQSANNPLSRRYSNPVRLDVAGKVVARVDVCGGFGFLDSGIS
jgi:hypothetical protein